jgi:bacteriocin biosynthesis cyclodehydratase domain-containing protein
MHGEQLVPRLSPRYRRSVAEDGAVVLAAEDDYVLVPPGPVSVLLGLVDGIRDEHEIEELLAGQLRAEQTQYLLLRLVEKGYLSRGLVDREVYAEESPSDDVQDPLIDRLRRELEKGRLPQIFDCGQTPGLCDNLRIVVAEDYLDPALDPINRRALSERHPYLLVRLGRTEVWCGPYVVPGQTPCWQCLVHRLAPNFPARAFALAREEGARVHAPASELHQALGLLVREIRSLGSLEAVMGQLIRIDGEGKCTRHLISRIPGCSHCGDAGSRPTRSAEICLRSRPKGGRSQSGCRSVDPAHTYEQYRHLIDPITGVVRELEHVPVPGTELVHSYTAHHAMHFGAPTVQTLRYERRDHSGGKGSTDLDARVSALAEAIERYSAVYRGDETARMASLGDLGGEAIHPNRCLLFSDDQFARRDITNDPVSHGFQWVPEPLAPNELISWTPCWSLTHATETYLPTALAYFSFEGPGQRFCRADSNGLAAGNCIEEAILQGFLELVERDAVAIWWYNRTRHPALDLASFRDEYVSDVCEYYARLGRSFWVLDVTSDLAIPCFVAVSASNSELGTEIMMGFGAHMESRLALRRAVTELNQALPTVLRSVEERRRQLLPEFRDAVDWLENATLDAHPYLTPNPREASIEPDAFRITPTSDLRDDVEACIEGARSRGLEVLVLDCTREDVGLSVARVVVPGLRHMWRRLGPGRLFDVPVDMGRLTRPLAEADLNPVPLFL